MWWSCALVLSYLQLQATTPSADAHPLTDWQQPPRNSPGLIHLHQQNYHYKPSSQQKQIEDAALEPFLQYRLKQLKILDSADDVSDTNTDNLNTADSNFDDSSSESEETTMEDIPFTSNIYSPKNIASKRAFTLLSRWHPFTLSRNAPSIKEHNQKILNDVDIETRAMLRPVGQPLRWG